MNIKDFVRVGQKEINLKFWMITAYLAGDSGMGFYYPAMLVYLFVYTVILGAMKETIARMVNVRRNKGFHDNAHRIFYLGLISSIGLGTVICIIFCSLSAKIMGGLFGYTITSSVLGLFGIYLLISSLNACLTGYYQGLGYVTFSLIGQVTQCVILVVASPFIVSSMCGYGAKVAALLKNPLYSNLNGAIGAVLTQCIATGIATLIIAVGVFKSYNEGYSDMSAVKGVDNKRSFVSNYVKVSFAVIEERAIPILAFLTMTIMFVKAGYRMEVGVKEIFVSLGVFAGKYLVVLAMPCAFVTDYVDKERKKLISDFRKEEHKNLRTRAGYLLKNVVYITAPIAISVIVLAKPIVMIFFGGKMSLGVTLVRQGGIVILFGMIAYAAKSILRSVSLELYSFVTSLAGYLAMVVFMLASVKSNLNISYMVYALVIYYFVQAVVSVLLVYRMIGVFIVDIGVKTAKVLGACLGLAIVEIILDKLIVMNILFLAIALVAGYLLYFVIIAISKGVTKKDISSLRGTLIYYPSSYFMNMFGGR